jgi:peroxiredoxin
MKKLLFVPVSALLLSFTLFVPNNEIKTLSIGDKAPMTDVKMKGTGGEAMSIADMKKENGVLVIFSCNTCPFVVGADGYGEGWVTRYNGVNEYAKKNKVGMILINSNEAKRGGDDSMEAMQKHVAQYGLTMPYVVDENHVVADAFGARTTPHVFLFDKNMNLVYKGAIDDNNESGKQAKDHYLNDALESLGKGEKIKKAETKNIGCSIKRNK